ncbi:hypothetical protein PCASD_25805 [Puccinia coronata f. sp. avenae]|uniref:Golgi to ER traffic-protein n=1 Tax=Puccinia coronata f. sp. avenae TaxID=200324 RepID=A0A2N5TH66_9BASI|nr:hypothetical protein PCASD_25805 [Puccinia coronata f. sp. avenae]
MDSSLQMILVSTQAGAPRWSIPAPPPMKENAEALASVNRRIAFLKQDHLPLRGWNKGLDKAHDAYVACLELFLATIRRKVADTPILRDADIWDVVQAFCHSMHPVKVDVDSFLCVASAPPSPNEFNRFFQVEDRQAPLEDTTGNCTKAPEAGGPLTLKHPHIQSAASILEESISEPPSTLPEPTPQKEIEARKAISPNSFSSSLDKNPFMETATPNRSIALSDEDPSMETPVADLSLATSASQTGVARQETPSPAPAHLVATPNLSPATQDQHTPSLTPSTRDQDREELVGPLASTADHGDAPAGETGFTPATHSSSVPPAGSFPDHEPKPDEPGKTPSTAPRAESMPPAQESEPAELAKTPSTAPTAGSMPPDHEPEATGPAINPSAAPTGGSMPDHGLSPARETVSTAAENPLPADKLNLNPSTPDRQAPNSSAVGASNVEHGHTPVRNTTTRPIMPLESRMADSSSAAQPRTPQSAVLECDPMGQETPPATKNPSIKEQPPGEPLRAPENQQCGSGPLTPAALTADNERAPAGDDADASHTPAASVPDDEQEPAGDTDGSGTPPPESPVTKSALRQSPIRNDSHRAHVPQPSPCRLRDRSALTLRNGGSPYVVMPRLSSLNQRAGRRRNTPEADPNHGMDPGDWETPPQSPSGGEPPPPYEQAVAGSTNRALNPTNGTVPGADSANPPGANTTPASVPLLAAGVPVPSKRTAPATRESDAPPKRAQCQSISPENEDDIHPQNQHNGKPPAKESPEADENSQANKSPDAGAVTLANQNPQAASANQQAHGNSPNYKIAGQPQLEDNMFELPINLDRLIVPSKLKHGLIAEEVQRTLTCGKMDPGLYIQPAVMRIFAAIMLNRQVVDDRSASQRPPQNPLERYVLDVASTSWKPTVASINDPKFLLLLNACPRLFQLPWPHPFLNEEHVRLDVLSYAVDKHLKKRGGGWMALNQMMCRSTATLPHHNGDFKAAVGAGARRLHQTLIDSLKVIRPRDGIPPQPGPRDTSQETETQGLGRIADWLSTRISVCHAATGKSHIAHPEGLPFVLKRCWEMLLGVSLMYDAKDTSSRKADDQSMLRSTFIEGTRSCQQDKHKWHEKRLRAYSALGLFLNFGVAGWFHCHTNRRHFHFKDVISLFHLGQEMAANKVTINSKLVKIRGTQGERTEESIHLSWERLNDYLLDMLIETGVGRRSIDWYNAAVVWDRSLTESRVANLILKDFFSELINPGDTLSSTAGCAPVPQIKQRDLEEWQSRAKKVFIPVQRHRDIEERVLISANIVERPPGRSHEAGYVTDNSDADAEGEDDDEYEDDVESEDETDREAGHGGEEDESRGLEGGQQ